jgi:hypothetical protein
MWTGRRFHLRSKILAIELGAENTAFYIPAGDIVEVTSGPSVTAVRLIQVRWQGRRVSVFTTDLQAKGDEVQN